MAAAFWTCHSIAAAMAMRSWVEVPAVIESVNLEESEGEDSTTYKISATYTYDYAGRTYSGNRVGIDEGFDNIGPYHHRMYARLSQQEVSKESATCYVDPERPERAILDRNLRWGMLAFKAIFALLFGGAGIGIMAGGIVARRNEKMARQAGTLGGKG